MARLPLNPSGHSVELPAKLLHYEPTHASRYWILANILKSLEGGSGVSLLDVGGKKGLLRFFDKFTPTIIDIEESNEPRYVQGSALDMPFKDGQFDYAVSCDVLEHIHQPDRKQFISEMLRVSAKGIIICAPFDNPGNADLEVEMNDYYKHLAKRDHRWLGEHIENGLPQESEVEKVLRSAGFDYVKFRHFSPETWRVVVKQHLMHSAFGDNPKFGAMTHEMYKLYYQQLCSVDFSDNGYRTFFVVSKKNQINLQLPSRDEIEAANKSFLVQTEALLSDVLKKEMKEKRALLRKTGKLNAQLAASNGELAKAKAELESIKSSKGWRIYEAAGRPVRKVKSVRHASGDPDKQ